MSAGAPPVVTAVSPPPYEPEAVAQVGWNAGSGVGDGDHAGGGRAVEDVSQRTADTQTFANPARVVVDRDRLGSGPGGAGGMVVGRFGHVVGAEPGRQLVAAGGGSGRRIHVTEERRSFRRVMDPQGRKSYAYESHWATVVNE